MKNSLFLNDNQYMTSRSFAEKLGQKHKDVVKGIRDLECSQAFSDRNFQPNYYKSAKSKSKLEYFITRDGLMYLLIGFRHGVTAKIREELVQQLNLMKNSSDAIEKEIDKKKFDEDSVICYTIHHLAAELGISVEELNRLLGRNDAQYWDGKRWRLNPLYINNGYGIEATLNDEGEEIPPTIVWLDKGRWAIHSMFNLSINPLTIE